MCWVSSPRFLAIKKKFRYFYRVGQTGNCDSSDGKTAIHPNPCVISGFRTDLVQSGFQNSDDTYTTGYIPQN